MSITFSFYSCIIREIFAVIRMLPFQPLLATSYEWNKYYFHSASNKVNSYRSFYEFYYVKNKTVDLSENPLIDYKTAIILQAGRKTTSAIESW